MPAKGKRPTPAGGATQGPSPAVRAKRVQVAADVFHLVETAVDMPDGEQKQATLQSALAQANGAPGIDRSFLVDYFRHRHERNVQGQVEVANEVRRMEYEDHKEKMSHLRDVELNNQKAFHAQSKATKENDYAAIERELVKRDALVTAAKTEAKQQSDQMIKDRVIHQTNVGSARRERQEAELKTAKTVLSNDDLKRQLADVNAKLKQSKEKHTAHVKATAARHTEEMKQRELARDAKVDALRQELTDRTAEHAKQSKASKTASEQKEKESVAEAKKRQTAFNDQQLLDNATRATQQADAAEIARLKRELTAMTQSSSSARSESDTRQKKVEAHEKTIDVMNRDTREEKARLAAERLAESRHQEALDMAKKASKKVKKDKRETEQKQREAKDAGHEELRNKLQAEIDQKERELKVIQAKNRKLVSGTSEERVEEGGPSDLQQAGHAITGVAKKVGKGLVVGAKSAVKAAVGAFTGGGGAQTAGGKGGPPVDGGQGLGWGFGETSSPDQSSSSDGHTGPSRKPPKPPEWVDDDDMKMGDPDDDTPSPPPLPSSPPPIPGGSTPPEVVTVQGMGGPTIAGVVGDLNRITDSVMNASPSLAKGMGLVGTALAIGGANRAYNWVNPAKQPGPNTKLPPGVTMPAPRAKKKQKTVVDADTDESGGGTGEGRGTSEGRKQQTKEGKHNFQSQGGYLTQQPWDMPKSQLLENGSDPDPKPPDPDGPDPLKPGAVWPPVVLPANMDRATDTLRPRFGMVGPRDVIPSPIDQLRSDIAFDMFSFVQPGHGNGYDNKLFQYQENTMNNVQAMGRSFLPRPDDGRLNYQHPMPFQWQSVQDVARSARLLQKEEDLIPLVNALVRRLGEGSSGVLGRDVGEAPVAVSSQGLRRDMRSVFEPVIQNADNMHPTIDPAGYLLSKRGWRRDFSPWREPQIREIQPPMNRGPHLNKRRSLEVILP